MFEEADAQVLGISTDTLASHRMFAQSIGGVPYPLLSDFHPKGMVSQAFGVWNADRGTSWRAVIIIDKQGAIRYKRTWSSGRPDPEEVLEEVRKIA